MKTRAIGIAEVLGNPAGVAQHLRDAGIYGLVDVNVRLVQPTCVVLWLTLEPWAITAQHGYPTERLSIIVWADGRIAAVPLDADRPWLHWVPGLLCQLCLWYPNDPRGLRWEWSDGLVAYVTIAHRHLQAEECWRRHGIWPAEDAPHGDGDHPIRSLGLRWATSRERR